MGVIGKFISSKIETFILNTIETKFGYNIKGETYASSGDDSPGLPDDRVYLGSIDGQGRSVVVGTLSVSQGAEAGEKILYSRDASGNVVAKIYFKKDGKIEINGDDNLILQNGTDNAVRYAELETAYNQLKQDYDDQVIIFNGHIHTTTATVGIGAVGVISPPTSSGSSSTGDISTAKIDNINVPGVGE